MKKMNRKGFTIVELVIVIAVIAILAGVMIPTFSGIVEKAQKNAVLQEARNAYTEVYAEDVMDGTVDGKKNATTDITMPTVTGATITYANVVDGENTVLTFTFVKNQITAKYTAAGGWDVTK